MIRVKFFRHQKTFQNFFKVYKNNHKTGARFQDMLFVYRYCFCYVSLSGKKRHITRVLQAGKWNFEIGKKPCKMTKNDHFVT